MDKTFELGTQFPHDIMTGDFTSRASSETTETIVMKKVRGYQRYITNKLKKELFEPLLEQNGFNTQDAELEISFTAQNIVELLPDQVLLLFTSGVITLEEVRDWYQSNTGMDMEEEALQQLIDKKDEESKMEQDNFKLQNKPTKESFGYEETKRIMEK